MLVGVPGFPYYEHMKSLVISSDGLEQKTLLGLHSNLKLPLSSVLIFLRSPIMHSDVHKIGPI